jgi:hypothetical protein
LGKLKDKRAIEPLIVALRKIHKRISSEGIKDNWIEAASEKLTNALRSITGLSYAQTRTFGPSDWECWLRKNQE